MDQEPIQPTPAPVEPISLQPVPSSRSFNPFSVLVVIVLLALVGVSGIFLGKSLNTSQLSTQPTIAPLSTQIPTPTPDETAYPDMTGPNWKEYKNTKLGFSIMYSPQMYFYETEYPASELVNKRWEIRWTNVPREKVVELYSKNQDDPGNSKTYQALHDLGHYNITIFIEENAKVYLNRKPLPLTIENLISTIDGGIPVIMPDVQGRKAVQYESDLGWGNLYESGVGIEYYIIDKDRLFRLEGVSYNLQLAPKSYIDQILSTFKFLE